jgi:hypothetical protein
MASARASMDGCSCLTCDISTLAKDTYSSFVRFTGFGRQSRVKAGYGNYFRKNEKSATD